MLRSYLSCQVVDLNEATHLGQGTFSDAGDSALITAGGRLKRVHPYVNPFLDMTPESFDAALLVFAGNWELTTEASTAGGVDAGQILEQDVSVHSAHCRQRNLFISRLLVVQESAGPI